MLSQLFVSVTMGQEIPRLLWRSPAAESEQGSKLDTNCGKTFWTILL